MISTPWLRTPYFLIAVYIIVLASLLPLRPLWLDEVIQLTGTVGQDWSSLLQQVGQNAGGAPLGYLPQFLLAPILGAGKWTARLPSSVAALGCALLLYFIGQRLALRWPILAVIFWIICPLTLRYSLEGRPYMQGVFCALLATWIQLRLIEAPRLTWALALGASLACALYSQPYAIFAPFGFSLFVCLRQRNQRLLALTIAAYAVAGLAFLPWVLTSVLQWKQTIAAQQGGFQLTPSLLLLILRELAGGGYFASLPILILTAIGLFLRHADPSPWSRPALLSAIGAGILLALAADQRFNYFFAIRQVIYILPVLLLLAADAAGSLWTRQRHAFLALIAIFVFASLAKNYSYFTDTREDWVRLSDALVRSAGSGCVLATSHQELANYQVFRPEIAGLACPAEWPSRVVLPVTPYNQSEANRLRQSLQKSRTKVEPSIAAGFAHIDIFVNAKQ